MALILDKLPNGDFLVAKSTEKGIVTGKVGADGSITNDLAAAFLDDAADTLETKIEPHPGGDNVVKLSPGDDKTASEARILANKTRLGL